MDLSKRAKSRRNDIEEPLFQLEKLLDDLEECRTRIDAAIAVWPETKSTLRPALKKQSAIAKEMTELKRQLSKLWQRGYLNKWSE